MTLTTAVILFFLMAAVLLYALLGGADFGAGILELFLPRRLRANAQGVISHAMAPVWEANHVWLILAVVILFMGFPPLYTALTTYLHLPLLLLLLGIVGRGCAFTFRHYDTPSIRSHRIYSGAFSLSSLGCALMLGILAGGTMLGRVDPHARSFMALYGYSWLNSFCLATGVFAVALFVFLASVYLVGESQEPDIRRWFLRAAAYANVTMLLAGGLVFITAQLEGLGLFGRFFSRPYSAGAFVCATAFLIPFWYSLLRQRSVWTVRAFGAALVSLVLLGWYSVQYPVAIALSPPSHSLTFLETAAPAATQRALLMALLAGSAIIFPASFYLLRVFKWETLERERNEVCPPPS